jgi:hypothetical protein
LISCCRKYAIRLDDVAGRSLLLTLYNTSCEETMSDDPEADAILTRFRAALGKTYGGRL